MSNFPTSLTHLGIGILPFLPVPLVNLVLQKLGPQLEYLEAKNTRRFIGKYSLDHILRYLPVIRRLSIPTEQMSAEFFTCSYQLKSKIPPTLVELELTWSNEVSSCKVNGVVIDCDQILAAVKDGGLRQLKRLQVHQNLVLDHYDIKALDNKLKTLAREEAEASGSHKMIDAGVWIIDR